MVRNNEGLTKTYNAIRERIDALENIGFGILLYTGTSDAKGTLGGLVQVGRKIHEHMRTALRMAELCSNDPRSLDTETDRRACLHAKCVVVDGQHVFVSSANFTEAAQERNIEVGLLVRSRRLAEQLTNHFESQLDAGFLAHVC